jgi:type IV pilus assembly protein PilC
MAVTRDPDQIGTFSYEAITPTGLRIKGPRARMSAYSEAEVRNELIAQNYVPIWIKEITKTSVSLNANVGRRGLVLKPLQVSNFARALYQLIRAGIPMPRALEAISQDATIPRLGDTCKDMANKIANGSGIADTFAENPHAFDAIFCGYLAAGETTGNLPASLARLTVLTEKRAQMRSKIKAITAYPIIVSCVIALLVTLILIFLVPKYSAIYASLNSPLPGPTLLVVRLSKHVLPIHFTHIFGVPFIAPDPEAPLLWIGLVVLGVWLFLRSHREDPKVGERVDRIRFHLPISGKLTHKLVLYRWCSTLAGALASSVQTTEALGLASMASGSRWMRVITIELQAGIQAGHPLSELMLLHTDVFPADIRTMVSTGEAAGETGIMLEASAASLSDEIDSIVAGLSARIEVALLLTMGVTVGSLLIALYLPILHLAQTFQNSAAAAP